MVLFSLPGKLLNSVAICCLSKVFFALTISLSGRLLFMMFCFPNNRFYYFQVSLVLSLYFMNSNSFYNCVGWWRWWVMMNCFCGTVNRRKGFSLFFEPGPLSEILTISTVKIIIEPGHFTYQPKFLIKLFEIMYKLLKKILLGSLYG